MSTRFSKIKTGAQNTPELCEKDEMYKELLELQENVDLHLKSLNETFEDKKCDKNRKQKTVNELKRLKRQCGDLLNDINDFEVQF